MNIAITQGTGTGPTEMAAFDKALVEAGVANYNLIYLSSIIPAGSKLHKETPKLGAYGEWGDRLYVVMSQARAIKLNEEAWAGIGWMQDDRGRGMLVEHEGHSESTVRADIVNSLHAFCKNRNKDFGPIHMEVTGITCTDQPVCAMVVAIFEGSGWRSNRQGNILSWMGRKGEKTKAEELKPPQS